MGKLESLNKDELASLGESSGVTLDPENQTKAEMIEALNAGGVNETPGGGEDGGGEDGGGDTSQPRSIPGSTHEVPELDPETALGVNPRPSGPRNPGLDYDDDAAGQPV